MPVLSIGLLGIQATMECIILKRVRDMIRTYNQMWLLVLTCAFFHNEKCNKQLACFFNSNLKPFFNNNFTKIIFNICMFRHNLTLSSLWLRKYFGKQNITFYDACVFIWFINVLTFFKLRPFPRLKLPTNIFCY